MHPHLERRHRRPRPPRDFVVRQPFDMLQHEDFALLRREVPERPLECPPPLRLLERPIRPVRRRHTVVALIERPPFPLPPAPLRVAAIAQDQEQPPRKLVRLAAIRQAIERPHQRVLHRVFARVEGAQHARRVAGVAVAVAVHQHRVPLHLAPQDRPHDLAVRCVARETQPSPSLPEVVQVMLGAAADAGTPSAPKESPGARLVTPDPAATWGTIRYLARVPALFYGNTGGSRMPQHNRSVADRTLLGRVASGDTVALRELEQRHGSSVYALAYGIVIDPGEADEVVAETFAYVWMSAARFVETANTSVASWLGEITPRRARARARARARPRCCRDAATRRLQAGSVRSPAAAPARCCCRGSGREDRSSRWPTSRGKGELHDSQAVRARSRMRAAQPVGGPDAADSQRARVRPRQGHGRAALAGCRAPGDAPPWGRSRRATQPQRRHTGDARHARRARSWGRAHGARAPGHTGDAGSQAGPASQPASAVTTAQFKK